MSKSYLSSCAMTCRMKQPDRTLPNAQVRALLKSPSPLADVFAAWEDRETSYMEEIWQTVTDRAREEAQKSRNTLKER